MKKNKENKHSTIGSSLLPILEEYGVDIIFGIDEYPNCPNFIGQNPYDCHGDCFDWNDSKVKIYYEKNSITIESIFCFYC